LPPDSAKADALTMRIHLLPREAIYTAIAPQLFVVVHGHSWHLVTVEVP
jgi:hypothetical protein